MTSAVIASGTLARSSATVATTESSENPAHRAAHVDRYGLGWQTRPISSSTPPTTVNDSPGSVTPRSTSPLQASPVEEVSNRRTETRSCSCSSENSKPTRHPQHALSDDVLVHLRRAAGDRHLTDAEPPPASVAVEAAGTQQFAPRL